MIKKTDVRIDRKRHLLKAMTYRVITSSVTIYATYLITGNITMGLSVGVVELLVKPVIYYFHERIWYNFSSFGVHRI